MGADRSKFTEQMVREAGRLVAAEPALSRTALSRRVCGLSGWHAPNGSAQQMSCRLALNELDQQGRIQLPPPRRHVSRPKYRRRNDRRTCCRPEWVIVPLKELGEAPSICLRHQMPIFMSNCSFSGRKGPGSKRPQPRNHGAR